MTHNTTTQKEAGTALQVLNEAIQSSKAIKKEAGEVITTSVKDIIAFLIEEGKKDQSLAHITDAKKRNQSIALIYLKGDTKMDDEVKKAIKIAYKIFSGYTLRKEWLSIAQMLKLITLDIKEVNSLFSKKVEQEYLDAVKTLLDNNSHDKIVRQFGVPKAQKTKL